MLRVTVELIPHGDEKRKREIGRIEIVNTGDHPERPVKADYRAMFLTTAPTGDLHASNRRILDFDRLRGNVWRLVHAALVALGEEAMNDGGDPSRDLVG